MSFYFQVPSQYVTLLITYSLCSHFNKVRILFRVFSDLSSFFRLGAKDSFVARYREIHSVGYTSKPGKFPFFFFFREKKSRLEIFKIIIWNKKLCRVSLLFPSRQPHWAANVPCDSATENYLHHVSRQNKMYYSWEKGIFLKKTKKIAT